MTTTYKGRPLKEVLDDREAVLKERCRVKGHVPTVINDCDDWPNIRVPGDACCCRLVYTKARACSRCRILLVTSDGFALHDQEAAEGA